MARKPAPSVDWYGKAQEVPRAETPSRAAHKATRNKWRLAIQSSLVLAPIAVLSCLIILMSPKDTFTPGSEVPGRTLATTTVTKWLDDGTMLPSTARPVWSSGERNLTVKADNRYPAQELWTHTFYAYDGDLRYEAQISVSVSTWGEVVVGSPLLDVAPTGGEKPETVKSFWDGATGPTLPIGDALEKTVSSWAKALVGGDPQILQAQVGDPSLTSSYQPLNLRLLSSTVVSAQPDLRNATIGYGRVELFVAGTCADLSDYGQPLTFDVLLHGVNSASPKVVAWGPPGTAKDLEKFENSVPATSIAPIKIDCR